jgi:ABC-type transport system involved in cytochrome bd biosynthesis fused ATPase/permease subunit
VLATLRLELFRTLLMQKIEFFDRHSASELQGLLSVELDTMRSFVFRWGCGYWVWAWTFVGMGGVGVMCLCPIASS